MPDSVADVLERLRGRAWDGRWRGRHRDYAFDHIAAFESDGYGAGYGDIFSGGLGDCAFDLRVAERAERVSDFYSDCGRGEFRELHDAGNCDGTIRNAISCGGQ